MGHWLTSWLRRLAMDLMGREQKCHLEQPPNLDILIVWQMNTVLKQLFSSMVQLCWQKRVEKIIHCKTVSHSKWSTFKIHQNPVSWSWQIIEFFLLDHVSPLGEFSEPPSNRTGVCHDNSDFIGDVVTRKTLFPAIIAKSSPYIILWNAKIL